MLPPESIAKELIEFVSLLWHRVVPTLVKRITTSYTLHPQPDSFDEAELADGFSGILRTGRAIPALRLSNPGYSPLVQFDHSQSHLFHIKQASASSAQSGS
jgi:hypothetical protein